MNINKIQIQTNNNYYDYLTLFINKVIEHYKIDDIFETIINSNTYYFNITEITVERINNIISYNYILSSMNKLQNIVDLNYEDFLNSNYNLVTDKNIIEKARNLKDYL